MKRLLSIVIVMSMMLSMLMIGGVGAPASADVRGDLNGDGTLSSADARMLLGWLVSASPMTTEQKIIADVNGDGRANTTDVKKILDVIMNGDSFSETGDLGTWTASYNLLPPTPDDWVSPLQQISGAYCTVSSASGATHQLVNLTERDEGTAGTMLNPYTWPYAAYAYDDKLLVPASATLEFDVTVTAEAASICLYLGGDLPHFDDNTYPNYVKINSFITTNVDKASGDLYPGSYKGTISMADILYSGRIAEEAVVDGYLWVSGIKAYVVGYNETGNMTINTLKIHSTYVSEADTRYWHDPLAQVRQDYIYTSETSDMETLTAIELFENGERIATSSTSSSKDYKKLYHTQNMQRFVNYPDGYQIDLPYDYEPDFSLSEIRTRFTSGDSVLTISKEEESPYANTADGWNTYLTEWVNRYIADEGFLSSNYIRYTREPVVSESIISGYTVMTYDMAIDWQGDVEMPFYSIALIRKYYTYNSFYLVVLKSKGPTTGQIDRLLRSFKAVSVYGKAVNSQGQYERVIPANWSAETTAYYNKLVTQNTTDWGFFSASMVASNDGSYTSQYDKIATEYERITGELGRDYDIMPTYTHLAYGSNFNDFPLQMANEFAGGNGFNGKPVLQFTFQYTFTNNTKLDGPTPIFNVLRGDYDDYFRRLAADIKTYKQPILLRLNNEMNSDWTSYCGLVSLLDPDIFIMGWQRMYDIFEEEGVNNCIWIFNPFTPTYPNCSWGSPLCFMPGEEYVQILGLTSYQMGNDTSTFSSFQTMYTEVYNESKDYFLNYPWVISEFACGSGGEKQYNWSYGTYVNTTLHRNWYTQYNWIVQMFNCLNNRSYYTFCQNIKGAVWFNVNDYVYLDGKDYVINALALDDSFTYAWQAFRNGISAGG